jgi:radical SAM protein with 4Fe4S-binding SPASM domain
MEKINMSDFVLYETGCCTIFVSRITGDQIMIPKESNIQSKQMQSILFKMVPKIPQAKTQEYDKTMFKIVYISIHGSSQCNLACRYCFMIKREKQEISIYDAQRFIDLVISYFPDAGKFIVDPTGSGEPLIRTQFMIDIATYCRKKSDDIQKEILPMLVTNGTLLTRENVKKLQDSGYIFGVSMDGYKQLHDSLRVYSNGSGTFSKIIHNVKEIKHREFMGVAVTITNRKTNLVKTLKQLVRYFPTISIKPVRSQKDGLGIDSGTIETVLSEYDALFEFLVNKTLKNNLKYIGALLNGDDYFGKFLLRVFLGYKVATRCDAGIGRFSLAPTGSIYACPAAIGLDPLVVGNLTDGLDLDRITALWKILIEKKGCDKCEARFVCGGECLVVSLYNSGADPMSKNLSMCQLNRRLFELAVRMKFILLENAPATFRIIKEGCERKLHRFDQDTELIDTLKKTKGEYTFMRLKHLKDDFHNQYEEIRKDAIYEKNTKSIKS